MEVLDTEYYGGQGGFSMRLKGNGEGFKVAMGQLKDLFRIEGCVDVETSKEGYDMVVLKRVL